MNKLLNPAVLASFLLVCVIFGYFSFTAPYMTDNYVFSLDISPNYAHFYSGREVKASPLTLAGAFRQACDMYTAWCGRFAGNLAVYLAFLLPSWLGRLASTLGFGAYILLLQISVFGREWRENLTPSWILALAALVWFSLPSFGEAFFWLSVGGQIALLAQILMLLPYRLALSPRKEPPAKNSFAWILGPLFFLAGAITSSLDYPTSAALPPTALIAVAYLYFSRKKGERKIPWILLCGALGLLAGGAATIMAPGNAQRLLLTNDGTVLDWLALSWPGRIGSWLFHLPLIVTLFPVPLAILAWGGVTLWRAEGKNFYKFIPPSALLYLAPFCFTIGAYLFTAWPPERAFATCAIQLLLCALIVAVRARPFASPFLLQKRRLFQIMLAACCVVSIMHETSVFHRVHGIVKIRENIISSAAGGEAALPRLPTLPDKYMPLGGPLGDLEEDPAHWVNRAMALHYGLKKVYLQDAVRYTYEPEEKGVLPGLKIYLDRGHFFLQTKDRELAALLEKGAFIYYYGRPGVVSNLWSHLGDYIYSFFADAKEGEGLLRLAPLLFARTDLKPADSSGDIFKSPVVRLDNPETIWLVKPGGKWNSFDLIPFKAGPGEKAGP